MGRSRYTTLFVVAIFDTHDEILDLSTFLCKNPSAATQVLRKAITESADLDSEPIPDESLPDDQWLERLRDTNTRWKWTIQKHELELPNGG